MLQIPFFSDDMIKEYEHIMADKVKARNSQSTFISFIPGASYSISIHDLLTLDRKQIMNIDGIRLYMYICSIQKYKTMSNVDFFHSLSIEFPTQVIELEYKRGHYKYEVNGIPFSQSKKDDTSPDPTIKEGVSLIVSVISGFNATYASKYFRNAIINSIADFSKILENMFCDLKQMLKGSVQNNNGNSVYIIDYAILPDNLRHKLMNSIGLRTCPYCNRNYITRYGVGGKKSTADLDHFYQKEQYPLFALSLFNFVPSCPICNSRMKNIRPSSDTMYPYEEGFGDDVHFELIYTGADTSSEKMLHLWQAIKDVSYDDFEVELIINPSTPPDKKQRIEKSSSLFHLSEVYADHKQDALEVALRTRIYCEGSYEDFCIKLFDKCKQKAGMTNTSVSDLKSFLFREGFDEEWLKTGVFINNDKKRYDKPLSKMIYDIFNSEKS